MPITLRGPRKAVRGKCERGHESVNAGAEVQTRTGRVRKSSRAMGARRGRLSAPWLRFHGAGRADVYNNTRARVLLRRMCVKSADLTTHSPPKAFARPRTATRPSRVLPLPHAAPTPARRLRDAFPADRTPHSPPKTSAPPRTTTPPSRTLPLPHAAPTHARRLRDAFPADGLRSPPHSDTPSPSTSAPHAAPTHARRLCDAFPAALTTHSPPKTSARPRTATRCLSFRSASGTKKRHRTVHVRCRMSRSTVVAVGHLGW